jgi:hypothetical protein
VQQVSTVRTPPKGTEANGHAELEFIIIITLNFVTEIVHK